MRAIAPPPFTVRMAGPEGTYSLRFHRSRASKWEGFFDVELAGRALLWPVELVERNDGGELLLSGTAYAGDLWSDVFWFELVAEPPPPYITYYGDQVVWRVDRAVPQPPSPT